MDQIRYNESNEGGGSVDVLFDWLWSEAPIYMPGEGFWWHAWENGKVYVVIFGIIITLGILVGTYEWIKNWLLNRREKKYFGSDKEVNSK